MLPEVSLTDLAELRREVSHAASRPLVLQRYADPAVRRFVARADLPSLAARGPLTPDHVIRTKPTPMVGRDVAAFADSYSSYFAKYAPARADRADDARSGTPSDPRRRARHGHGGVVGTRGQDRRRHLPPHDSPFSNAPRITSAATSRCRPEQPVRGRVLGARAGEATARRRAVGARRDGCARHRSCFRDRARLRRGVARARRRRRRPRPLSRCRDTCPTVRPGRESSPTSPMRTPSTRAARDRRGVRRHRHRGHRSGRLRAERANRRARGGGVALGPVGQRRLGRAPSPRPLSIPRTLSGRWPGRRHRVEERLRARAQRGRLFRVEGGSSRS